MSTDAAPFEQIAEHFRGQISDGTLKAGDKLPTVRQIGETWDVARQTASRAIERLRNEGLVTTAGRAGTIVSGAELQTIAIAVDGLDGLDVKSVDVHTASELVARELNVSPGTSIMVLRVRAVGG